MQNNNRKRKSFASPNIVPCSKIKRADRTIVKDSRNIMVKRFETTLIWPLLLDEGQETQSIDLDKWVKFLTVAS